MPAAPGTQRPDCVRPPRPDGGREAVRCLAGLAGLPCGVPALRGLRAAGPTSKVKLDVRRRGPGGQKGPSRRVVLVSACQTGRPGGPAQVWGARSGSARTTPTLFVNLVNCKSNTVVFFILLVGWVLPVCRPCTAACGLTSVHSLSGPRSPPPAVPVEPRSLSSLRPQRDRMMVRPRP